MTIELIPAIDLRGGRCVRLYQGDYARETVYDDDPAEVARRWQALGARRLHIVDLDGARDGETANTSAVEAIIASVSIDTELGGGIRNLAAVERWLDRGVGRVYMGTAAVTDPGLVETACRRFPGRIAAGADARGGRIAVRGWQSESAESVIDFARRVVAAGVAALSYTDVSRDGTFAGPNLLELQDVIAALPVHSCQVILAGGVGSLEHILEAARVPGLDGVIIGRALYEGRVDLVAALAAVQRI